MTLQVALAAAMLAPLWSNGRFAVARGSRLIDLAAYLPLLLALGIGMTQVLEMVRVFRSKDANTPVVLMGYANPVERYDLKHGADSFVRDAAAAGVDGVLIVDYPPEECAEFAAQLQKNGLDLIFLLAPTSTDQRTLPAEGA